MKKIFVLVALLFTVVIPGYTQTQLTLSDILENVLASVVTVSVEKTEDTKQILGFRGQEADIAYEKILDLTGSKSSGSGFVIEKNGKKYVITNAHVIENASETAGSVFIYTIDRTKYEGKVIGGDSFYDIAVLEFVKTPGAEVKAVAFSTKEPRIGEKVFAIGNPLGEYPYTVSDGIVSAKNRVRDGITGKFGFIQSTATVIWGNSGGPLINEKGLVVGINSQIAFAEVGGESLWQPQINFALEGILSSRLVDNIIANNGRVKRAYIGIELSQMYDYNAVDALFSSDGWSLTDSIPVLSGVLPGSPAEAVLKNYVGYKVVKIGNTEIRKIEEALGEFENLKPGDKVKLTLKNGATTQVVEFVTEELNPQKSQAIAYYAIEKTPDNVKLSAQDDKVYIEFGQTDYTAKDKMAQGEKGTRLRGENISYGKYQIVAAGYDSEKFKSMWRIKSLGDLGVALRLTASLGALDLYLSREGRYKEDPDVKRISFAGNDENKWKVALWY
ncbi:MAG: trypsin-like peptidase domain-containing protein [Bacteroidota bacterium]